jgi:hypothetical protein
MLKLYGYNVGIGEKEGGGGRLIDEWEKKRGRGWMG